MNNKRGLVLGCLCWMLLAMQPVHAQSLDHSVAEWLMQNDRLNAVIVVLLIIFAALIVFLIRQEQKIRQLQKKINNHHE
ncbi:MAG: hypothetical protein RMK52_04225 [Chitinophagales bacterium]|nr:hypothetical protein [Chitinophagales bacterium]MDW8393434.1 hypothetical protein [Chitinophagales bacterium]